MHSTPTRKPPQCRTCGQPMKGHRSCSVAASSSRRASSVSSNVKQEEVHNPKASLFSYASPPPTPPPRSDSDTPPPFHTPVRRTYPIDIMSEPSFVIPETGYFHRRNPNFVHSPPKIDVPRPSRSVTPTVIVGPDGRSVAPSVRSASPALSESSLASDVSHTTMIGLNTVSPHRGQNQYFNNGGVALIGGMNWQEHKPIPPNGFVGGATVNILGHFILPVRAVLSILVSFLRSYAPIFSVTLMATIIGCYVSKTYL